jgi:hypothetical protein
MSTIKISDLRPTGSELFSDSESYMSELGDNELDIINGGAITTPVCISISYSLIRASMSSAGCARSVVAVTKSITKIFG